MPTILVTESSELSAAAAATLRACGNLQLRDLDRSQLLAEGRDVDVLWVRLRHHIDAEIMEAHPRLKLIATPTTGLTHINLDEAARRDIQVVSLRGETAFLSNIHATAEHTLALILAMLRNLPTAARHVLDGGWDRDRYRGGELHGRTCGIVGFGRLGQMVAPLLLAFGARVLACDPQRRAADMPSGVLLVDEAALLAASDVVTLHVNLTAANARWFGEQQLRAMKPDAILVNTSRGELLDEAALLTALRDGRIAGAALDVLAEEQSAGMAAHPLVRLANVDSRLLITPHIGGCTVESMTKTEQFLAGKLQAILESQGLHENRRSNAGAG